jgi:hypothetical protein
VRHSDAETSKRRQIVQRQRFDAGINPAAAGSEQIGTARIHRLVLGAPPNHFPPSDLPLLAAYAKAIVEERIAAGELAAAYVVDGKPSPWLAIWQGKIGR